MNPMISIRDLSAAYSGKYALRNITAEIPCNKITAIIGPSGCGKSTLLRCLNGLFSQEPDTSMSGEITLDGQNIRTMATDELRRRVGLVFQTPAPFPFSIYRNMSYPLRYYGTRSRDKLEAAIEDKLKLAGLYDEVKDELSKSACKLSGGQQQRLCIARALTVEPDVLMLDEPCSALDVKSTQTIEELLIRLKEHYTVVVVTHNLAQARRISDKVLFLNNGELIEWGNTEEIFSAPKKERTRSFLSGMFG